MRAEARVIPFAHLLKHGVIARQVSIAIDVGLRIIAAGLGTVLAEPVDKQLAKHHHQRELTKAPRNTATCALVLDKVRVPRQV